LSCPAGTRGDGPDQRSCTSCAAGTHQPGLGKTELSSCLPCEAGSFCSTPASQETCRKGSHCPSGVQFPVSLSSGFYAVDSGEIYTEAGGVAEVVCEAGHHCSGGNRTVCEAEGDYCKEGSTAPTTCAIGFFCSDSASKTQCSLGNYCPPGSTAESACPLGFFCPSSLTKIACSMGSYCKAGSIADADCPAGM
jgi:hypothetical protein